MPFYEYKCAACGHEFEEFQKITDKPVKTCPECKKRKVRRLISQTSFVLKGSGWYVTDYARKGESSAANGDNGAKKDSGEKKAESKKTDTQKAEAKKDKPKTDTSSATTHH
ncbi:MAG: zinc ribbon domain-containing protein [Deltaproteobacteria bacterium]|nr:zinc ribbon domain-containing protein [Deltaproteobacteria bacterium]